MSIPSLSGARSLTDASAIIPTALLRPAIGPFILILSSTDVLISWKDFTSTSLLQLRRSFPVSPVPFWALSVLLFIHSLIFPDCPRSHKYTLEHPGNFKEGRNEARNGLSGTAENVNLHRGSCGNIRFRLRRISSTPRILIILLCRSGMGSCF